MKNELVRELTKFYFFVTILNSKSSDYYAYPPTCAISNLLLFKRSIYVGRTIV